MLRAANQLLQSSYERRLTCRKAERLWFLDVVAAVCKSCHIKCVASQLLLLILYVCL